MIEFDLRAWRGQLVLAHTVFHARLPGNLRLREALHQSEYLIVCCSSSSRGSSYVDLEIRAFLADRPLDRVLVCLVGEAAPELGELPDALAELERERGDNLLTPDLRGFSKDLRGSDKRRYEQAALSLLAPLVGLRDKGVLLDRRKKARSVAVKTSRQNRRQYSA